MALTARQNQVLVLDKDGKSQTEIAKILDITQQTVSRIQNRIDYRRVRFNVPDSPEVRLSEKNIKKIQNKIIQSEIKKQLDPVIQAFKNAALPAAQQVIMLSETATEDGIKFSASKEVLNQAGYVPEKKVTTMSVELSGKDAERISNAFTISQTRTREVLDDSPVREIGSDI